MATNPTAPTGSMDREPTLSAARLALAVKRARAEAGRAAELLLSEPIAVVGMGCRFPGEVASPAEYWQLLSEGRSGIRELPEGRWPGVRDKLPAYLRMGGFLDPVDFFDAEFFGIAPREAHTIDPQQRLLLEVAWEALSDAGIAPSSLSGSDTGIFFSVNSNDYFRMQLKGNPEFDAHSGVGAVANVAAGRVAFLLNLHGPCMTVDTACSSSLVTTHLACQALRHRQSSVALVGASSLKLLADEIRLFAALGLVAKDGRNKTFDEAADGFVPGEGCGVVVLKRLSDAVAQGDRIRAVIRGTAVNQDGRSSVLTAPSGPAQEAVIRAALRDAQAAPEDVGYVETHGTGTSLGDPIEVEALDAVYGAGAAIGKGAPGSECILGAVKTNFGHLEGCAGLAGLIKTVLVLENKAIPQNLNFSRLNPQIRMREGSRLRLATEARPWDRPGTGPGLGYGQPRFAGVSSFGLSGTNAHVILEEAPVFPRSADAGGPLGSAAEYCLPVSAHTLEGLSRVALDFAALLRQPGADLAEIARTAARGRDHAAFRLGITANSAQEAAEKLELRAASTAVERERRESAAGEPWQEADGDGKLAFVFPGQGALWPGMLAGLLSGFPEAEKVIAMLERVVADAAGWSLRAAAEDTSALEDTARAQPLLFAMQMALVRVLESWGVTPEAVAGHSAGEVAAAVTAGALTLEQGIRLVLKRGRRMSERAEGDPAGRMLAAELSEVEALSLLEGFAERGGAGVELAAMNGPASVVFAGPEAVLGKLAGLLGEQQMSVRWLEVKYAFHSAAMDAARRGLESDLQAELGLQQHRPSIPLVSTVSGELWHAGDGDAAYWGRQIREPVRFRQAVNQMFALGCRIVVEIGPHPVLLRSVAACAAETLPPQQKLVTVAAMRRGQPARATLMAAAAGLYEAGSDLAWNRIYPGPPAHADLPAYPWNRQRFWLPEPLAAPEAAQVPPVAENVAPVTTHAVTEPLDQSDQSDQSDQLGQLDQFDQVDLLGREVSSPFFSGKLWETRLDTASVPWLADHCFRGQPILPFTAWLELARRAAVAAEGEEAAISIREFAVYRPLELGDGSMILQTLAADGRVLKLAARSEAGASQGWTEFAGGSWEVCDRENELSLREQTRLDIAEIVARSTETKAVDTLYEELAEKGIGMGPAFRQLERVCAGPGFALGEVRVGSPPAEGGTGIHPALLDACLQTIQAAMPAALRGQAMLPVSVRSYRADDRAWRAADALFAFAELRRDLGRFSGSDLEADITVADRQGMLLAQMRGFRLRRVAAAEERPAPMWRTVWREFVPEAAEDQPGTPAAAIQSRWIVPGIGFGSGSASQASDSATRRMLAGIAAALEAQGSSVLVTSAVPAVSSSAAAVLAGSLDAVTRQVLRLVAMEHATPGLVGRICVVTRGAVAVHAEETADAGQAALWGLARTLRAEYPAIAVQLVDLPLSNAAAAELHFEAPELAGMAGAEANLLAEWLHALPPASDEAALRGNRFFRPRLEPAAGQALVSETALAIGTPGLLETLREEPWTPPDLAADEVQIACRAHGLNFRDVLMALDSYAGAGAEAQLGAEFSGVVVKAGKESGILPGAEVVGFAPLSLRSVVNVAANSVMAKPAGMSFAEAATIPVVFLTAHYGLSRLAQLQAGQTVLVHSAAGGLGQAALQLARRAGATVMATAGTPEKRAWLKAQGIEHVFDSRSDRFADRVLRVTGGEGVDVVLNALSGDKIAAGFKALRQGGAFLEVGKRDIWSAEQVAAVRPDARYWPFDLGEEAQRDPALVQEMGRELFAAFANGALTPLPHELYSMAEAETAFREMASGRHVGKLVLVRAPRPLPPEAWSAALREGSVLITGGTGALGMATARWLLAQGAQSLVLVSRGGSLNDILPLEAEFPGLNTLGGARVTVERADVSDGEQLAAVFTRLRQRKVPLRAVFHLAGEVNDRLLADHGAESFALAMKTKTEGARLLADLTAGDPLIATVYFSSMAALVGSPGQASYAAANAFLDGLAADRSARGLRTLSVNWGAWADGGMVDQLSEAAASRVARRGILPMQPANAVAALGEAILSGEPRAAIAQVDWAMYREQFPENSAARGFLSGYLSAVEPLVEAPAEMLDREPERKPAGAPVKSMAGDEMEAIRNAPRGERAPRMESLVRSSARKVLGLSAGRPMPPETPLQELGLDSLMALELRNVLAQAVGRPLSATLLFDYPNIRGLAQHLLALAVSEDTESTKGSKEVIEALAVNSVEPESPHEPPAENGNPATAAPPDFESQLATMSDAEAEELLLAELEGKGPL